MPEPAKRIPLTTLLHRTFCKRCYDLDGPDSGLCEGCIIAYAPRETAEAAREFVAKEQGPPKHCENCDMQVVESAPHLRWCGRCGSLEQKLESGLWEMLRPSYAEE